MIIRRTEYSMEKSVPRSQKRRWSKETLQYSEELAILKDHRRSSTDSGRDVQLKRSQVHVRRTRVRSRLPTGITVKHAQNNMVWLRFRRIEKFSDYKSTKNSTSCISKFEEEGKAVKWSVFGCNTHRNPVCNPGRTDSRTKAFRVSCNRMNKNILLLIWRIKPSEFKGWINRLQFHDLALVSCGFSNSCVRVTAAARCERTVCAGSGAILCAAE